MAGQYSVKETSEGLLALVVLGKFVADRLKDGAQLDDALALGQKLMTDGEFKSIVSAGVDGAEKIPAEIGELDVADYLELAKGLPAILAELSKAS
jgi:hypothetical protein